MSQYLKTFLIKTCKILKLLNQSCLLHIIAHIPTQYVSKLLNGLHNGYKILSKKNNERLLVGNRKFSRSCNLINSYMNKTETSCFQTDSKRMHILRILKIIWIPSTKYFGIIINFSAADVHLTYPNSLHEFKIAHLSDVNRVSLGKLGSLFSKLLYIDFYV